MQSETRKATLTDLDEIEQILAPLRDQTRTAIIRYDNCVENGKKGGKPRCYETCDDAKENKKNKTPVNPHDEMQDALRRLALGYTSHSHELINGRLVKTKYHPPNLKALEKLMKQTPEHRPYEFFTDEELLAELEASAQAIRDEMRGY